MPRISFILTLVFSCLSLHAQQWQIHEDLHTFRMQVGQHATDLPVIRLGGMERIEVSFDDMRHDYRRFTYSLQHVDADFQNEEGLFEGEYMAASDTQIPIEGYEQSMNTDVLYNHYSFTLPNADMRPLISGNYRLTIFVEDEDSDEPRPAITAYFCVVEPLASITMSADTDTEIDRNDRHQQLTLAVDCRNLDVRDAAADAHIVVRQNGRYDNAVVRPRPTSQMAGLLKWEHSRDLIFPAGNEYRKFEQTSTRYPGMHVDRVRYVAPYYYALLMPDGPRPSYLFDEDQNGRFVVRADRNGNADTEADYMWMLFRLQMPPLEGMEVYVDGIWTGHQLMPRYRMHYEPEDEAYELALLLKEGYYSYQYLAKPEGSAVALTRPVEGDYYQTENRYDVFVYCRQSGERYDRLVGWRQSSFNIRMR